MAFSMSNNNAFRLELLLVLMEFMFLYFSAFFDVRQNVSTNCSCSLIFVSSKAGISPSPRWCSGYPRTLLVLLEFESHDGEILTLFSIITKDQLLRAPSVSRRNSTLLVVDEGRKGWSLLAIKKQGTNRSGEGVEEPAMWPRVWVTTGREREKEGRR